MDDMLTERITLDLDEDVLEVANEQAEKTGEPIGKSISRKARHGCFALRGPISCPDEFKPFFRSEPLERIITTSFVKRLEEEADMEYFQAVFDQDEVERSVSGTTNHS